MGERPGRVAGLDVLRGCAAGAVMLHHHAQYYDVLYPGRTPLSFDLGAGHFGVELFFIISGFVILMTIERKKTILDFAVQRSGEVVQDGSTDEMKCDMHYLVADIARTITLFPGDVLLSGTPANSRPVRPGDVVEVEVEGLGTLRNTIVQGDTPIREDLGAQPSSSEEVESTALGGDWAFRGIRPPHPG